jgi:hypothetical protein
MAEPKKSMSRSGDPNPMENDERRVADTWENPGDHPGGSVSGGDVARPQDKEAAQGDAGLVPGATGSGTSGSQSARSIYGMAPEDENPEAE